MQTELEPNEVVLRTSLANMMRKWEGVGGKLYLTDRRLIFGSHATNFQTGTSEIPLGEVSWLAVGPDRLSHLYRISQGRVLRRVPAAITNFRFLLVPVREMDWGWNNVELWWASKRLLSHQTTETTGTNYPTQFPQRSNCMGASQITPPYP